MKMRQKRLSVVIVTYNNSQCIGDCIEGLKKQKVDFELFVVDNNSRDGTQDTLSREADQWPALKVIYNKENRGFAEANNQVLAEARGRYILFLNPDTEVKEGAIEQMIHYLECNPSVGAIGPKLIHPDGTLQVSCGPRWGIGMTLFWQVLPFRVVQGILRRRQSLWIRQGAKEVVWLLGACLMTRKSILVELGGIDERFFLTIMDTVDLCFRIIQKGYRVIYLPEATVVHLGGESVKKVKSLAHLHALRGQLHYHKKYNGSFSLIFLKIVFFTLSLVKSSFLLPFVLFSPKSFFPLLKAHTHTALHIIFLRI